MTTTLSEQLFELFCERNSIVWQRIATADVGGEQRPDYEIALSGQRVIVEVKQFDPTAEERRLLRQLEEHGSTDVFGGEPGDRARKKIARGATQLRAVSGGALPTMLVLYNNVRALTDRHTHSYAIKTAMYGLETITLAVPKAAPVHVAERGFARRGKKKVTPTDNTSLSAVAVLCEGSDGLWLLVYHNVHSRVPLSPGCLRGKNVRHFTLGTKATVEFQEWVET